jgi:carbon-monoxide dehydrogenase small subunit
MPDEVRLTVNGAPVVLAVEPRLTLADALRHRLGLTGTHVGCEHGVCGACTVLVDGTAVRSCLVFCVQADGAAVTTVEALGTVDDLHPLQAAFRRHHGLQCGFCTPGFLMSAYELLHDGGADALDDRRLREQLSGVLCRCTGYAGIVEAVREVAGAHRDGLPPPRALGQPLTVRGTVVEPATAPASAAVVGGPDTPSPPPDLALTVPEGPPSETIDVTTTVVAAPEQVWALLSDFERASRCMPGVALDAAPGSDTFLGHVRVHLGPMRLDFAGAARVLERNSSARTLRAIAAGRDRSGGGVRADVTFGAQPCAAGGTTVRAQARLYLSGRTAQFGR